ncbi:MAG: hypothetical protein ACKPKO_19000, partial [Candidatus Fonsibacter sp.]
MDELTSFSSPCYERFDMNPRLEAEAHACAAIANSYGHISFNLSEFWISIKPFCLNMESARKAVLHHFWDQLIKKLAYLALANSWGDRCRLRMTERELSPWSIPQSTPSTSPFAFTQMVDPPVSDLPARPNNLTEAMNTAQDIKRASGVEEVTVNRVADTEFANVLFTIGEEVDTDLWSTADVTAPAVVLADVPSEDESEGDLVGADIYVDIDAETGEFVPT